VVGRGHARGDETRDPQTEFTGRIPPAGPLLATCAADGTVRLWDYPAGTPRVQVLGPESFGGGVWAVAFTPDGHYLATANANGTVYPLRSGAPPR
jgi:WD40 repeat protein